VPRPGDRFFNKDYASTLRAIQKGGADAFYKGEIAKKIAADMEENGGILTYADLAQYRAIERAPVAGHYRGHTLYAGGPPLSTGIQLFESLHVLENLSAEAGSARLHGSGLPALFNRGLEGSRPSAPRRRSRTLADRLRGTLDRRARQEAVRDDRCEQSVSLRAHAADDVPTTPTAPTPRISTGTTSFAVADADGNMIAVTQNAQHLGRHVLRVERPRLSLQQSPAFESHDTRRLRQSRAVDAFIDVGGADAGVREEVVG
jgi:gamma-glutamyltranspeptidase/glutathione hydrolase